MQDSNSNNENQFNNAQINGQVIMNGNQPMMNQTIQPGAYVVMPNMQQGTLVQTPNGYVLIPNMPQMQNVMSQPYNYMVMPNMQQGMIQTMQPQAQMNQNMQINQMMNNTPAQEANDDNVSLVIEEPKEENQNDNISLIIEEPKDEQKEDSVSLVIDEPKNENSNDNVSISLEESKKEEINNIDSQVNNEIIEEKINPIKYERTENDYLKNYIGNNANKIMRNPINFSAFIFGYAYYFYRKSFVFGIISLLLNVGIPFIYSKLNYNNVYYLLGALVLSSLILSILFNKIYVNTSRKKVRSIISKHPGVDSYSLGNLLSVSGGTSFIYFLLACIIYGGATYYLGTSETLMLLYDEGYSIVSGNKSIDVSTGVITYDTVDLSKKINISLPEVFVETEKSNTKYKYSYNFDDNGNACSENCNSCEVTLSTVKGFRTAEQFAKAWSEYQNVSMSDITFNNIKWYTFNYEFLGNNIDFVTDKSLKLYYLNIKDLSNNNMCKKYIEQILSSISFK